MASPSVPGPLLVDDEPPRIHWTVVFLLFTAVGVLRFNRFYLNDLAGSVPGTFVRRLLEEGTAAYAGLLLFPLVVAVERRSPLTMGRWRRHWPAYVVLFFAYTATHTSLVAVSRAVLFSLLGYGSYDYGRIPVRYVMESAEDVITYCVLIGILTQLRTQRWMRKREVRAATLERDAANARLEALSLRLQPHFLFNALNTISSTVYDDPIGADGMIGRLGDLLRHALRSGGRPEITIAQELGTLDAYLTFVEARFGDRVRVSLDVDPSLANLAVPAFLLQPLVENAVRHGAARDGVETGIAVVISRVDGTLLIKVDNDADAGSIEPLRLGTGLGTTRDRLRLLYGAEAAVDATKANGRFSVAIRIPARVLQPAPDPSREVEHAGAHR